MKALLTIFSIFISMSAFALNWDNPNQSGNLTDYNLSPLNSYSAGPAVNNGVYTLYRDQDSPKKINIYIHKAFGDVETTTTPKVYGVKPNGSVGVVAGGYKVRDLKKLKKVITLVFDENLNQHEVEELQIALDFSSDQIDIEDINIVSNNNYDIDIDTWFLDDGIDAVININKIQ